MKKRIFAFIMIAVLIASLCACGKYSSLSVNGTKIGKGVYAYFEDRAKSENPEMSRAEQRALVNSYISRYVAINSEFLNRGCSLTTEQKSALSQTVGSYWRLFSAYYEDIGVSKQDLFEIEASKAYEEILLEVYYSADGDSPVSDEELKAYFNDNFIAFRAVTGFLTTVDSENKTVSLPQADRESINSVFAKMAEDINAETASLDDVSSYAENVAVTSETVVINNKSTSYPEGFYDNVKAIENNKAASFSIGDYVFAVQRNDIAAQELDLFSAYRSTCLKALKGEEFQSIIDLWTTAYTVE